MEELLFCNKCGKTSTSSSYKIGDKCYTCETGTYIGTGIDWSTAYMELSKEYEKTHDGHCPSHLESSEIFRQKYFYGKLDNEVDYSAVKKRKYSESPEGIEEQNRITDQWYAKQNAQKFSTGPKCPTCGSNNIRKISTGERMVSVGILGLFSKKINKSFKCNSCGYTW